MVAFSSQNKKYHGSGILDSFTANKYGNERHAYSLDPRNIGVPYRFVGPFSEVKLRDQLNDNIPLNELDRVAEKHDRAYLREKEAYAIDHDKKKHMNNIWKADDEFIRDSNNQMDDPIIGKISSKLIQMKKIGEQTGILDSKKYSGMGIKKNGDPIHRLRLVASKHRNNHQKKHEGGMIPLIPIAIGALGSLAGHVLSGLYDTIKKKLTGSGYYIPHHKTYKQKKDFLIQYLH